MEFMLYLHFDILHEGFLMVVSRFSLERKCVCLLNPKLQQYQIIYCFDDFKIKRDGKKTMDLDTGAGVGIQHPC